MNASSVLRIAGCVGFICLIALLIFLITRSSNLPSPSIALQVPTPTCIPVFSPTPTLSPKNVSASPTVQRTDRKTPTPTPAPIEIPSLKDGELGSIRGSVVDETGRALHLAEVQLQKKSGTGFVLVSTATAQKGNFLFPNLKPAIYHLVASHEFCSTSSDSIQIVDLKHREEAVTITLQRLPYTIRGIIREETTLKGVPNQSIVLLNEMPQFNRRNFSYPDRIVNRAASAKDGSFEFASVLPGAYVLALDKKPSSKNRYFLRNQIHDDLIQSPPGKLINVVDRDVDGVVLEALAMPLLSGTVYNQAGDAIEGATVSDYNSSFLSTRVLAITDREGNYAIQYPHLNNESNLFSHLYAYHPQHGAGRAEVDKVKEGERRENLDIVLIKGKYRIAGRLTVDGAPPDESCELRYNVNLCESQVVVSPNETEYEITGLPEGRVEIWVKDERYKEFYTQVFVNEEKPDARLDIDLKTKGSLSISGVVCDVNGNPLENVSVLARRLYSKVARTQTDSNGFYQITDLFSGTHDLHFVWKGDKTLENRLYGIEAGSENVDVTLGGNGYRVIVHGVLDDGSPFPLSRNLYVYRAADVSSVALMAESEGEGTVCFQLYQPERYIVAYQDGRLLGMQDIEIVDSSPLEISLDLPIREHPELVEVRGLYYETKDSRMPWFTFQLLGAPNQVYFPMYGLPGGNGAIQFVAQPGEYLLRLCAPRHGRLEIPVIVDEEILNYEEGISVIYNEMR